ncbi:hypothetical protein ADUPG1_009555 [Aduncisulcus paluster]|uniref:Mitochondrial import inner membrane translocase subunit TIM50 n=1 Tax=Aduncisulcus paluster TaxID=2918883 RepID=A0ABQ5KZX4_9EUKA|nr:hypothetical protein ADUPG1_009555 [Aduncisulcus paluster]
MNELPIIPPSKPLPDYERKELSSESSSLRASLTPSPRSSPLSSTDESFSLSQDSLKLSAPVLSSFSRCTAVPSISDRETISSTKFEPSGDYLSIATSLPPLITSPRSLAHSFTVVLDMDHTLLHASKKYYSGYERVIKAIDKGRMRDFYVRSRPYAREMVQELKRRGAEIVVYTAALQDYADQCLNVFDPSETLVDHRIYREGCVRITSEDMEAAVEREYDVPSYIKQLRMSSSSASLLYSRGKAYSSFGIMPHSHASMGMGSHSVAFGMLPHSHRRTGKPSTSVKGHKSPKSSASEPFSSQLPLSDLIFSNGYMKDLSRLGPSRPISSVLLIDDNPISYALQPLAAIPCREYRGEDGDEEMRLVAAAVLQAIEDKCTSNVSGVDYAVQEAEQHMQKYKYPEKTIASKSTLHKSRGISSGWRGYQRPLSSFFCIREEPELLEGCI